jgi:hypothetical protein
MGTIQRSNKLTNDRTYFTNVRTYLTNVRTYLTNDRAYLTTSKHNYVRRDDISEWVGSFKLDYFKIAFDQIHLGRP